LEAWAQSPSASFGDWSVLGCSSGSLLRVAATNWANLTRIGLMGGSRRRVPPCGKGRRRRARVLVGEESRWPLDDDRAARIRDGEKTRVGR
jgi:hypothetical protein